MESVPLQSRLVELLRRARTDEQVLTSSLSAEERAVPGTPEHWSAKDMMAHISVWEERLMQRLAEWARGESFSDLTDGEIEEVNAQVLELNRDRSWVEVQTEAERAFNQLLAVVSQFGEQELSNPTPVGWYNNRSLLASIVGNSYTHPLTHVSWFHLQRGDVVRAKEIQEAMARALVDIDGSAESRAIALYNLGCFYALSGESGRAIELIRQALPLRADLVEWSKHDQGLMSLRELPEYQALYTQ